MKVCKYCDSVCEDAIAVCPNCGAQKFSAKCRNCGTVIENGVFCQNCGVKIGTEPKTCPRCGKEYFSPACPECGYKTGDEGDNKPVVVIHNGTGAPRAPQQPRKQRKTWLWVLGWIFIFPLPLTLILIKKDMNKIAKIVIIVLAWLLYLGFAGSAAESPAEQPAVPGETVISAEDGTVQESTTQGNVITISQ